MKPITHEIQYKHITFFTMCPEWYYTQCIKKLYYKINLIG